MPHSYQGLTRRVPHWGGGAALIPAMRALVDKYGGAYWGIQDPVGESTATAYLSSAYDGTYYGVTLEQSGPAGTLAGLFDSANDYIDVLSASLISAFDPDQGTLIAFAKVANAGVWTDGIYRYAFMFQADSDNFVRINKSNTNNLLQMRAKFGGAWASGDWSSISDTGWMATAITWNKSASEFITYLNGISNTPVTITGTWVGSLTNATFGSANANPSAVWLGDLSHCAWLTGVATPAELLNVAQLGGTT